MAYRQLLDDRIEFKLYASKYHLDQLKKIESEEGGIGIDKNRIMTEILLDGFFGEIIGAKDALLYLVDSKLKLGIAVGRRKVLDNNVREALKDAGKQSILSDYFQASESPNWFWQLNELRNQAMHRSYLQKVIEIIEDWSDVPVKPRMRFVKPNTLCKYCNGSIYLDNKAIEDNVICPNCNKWNLVLERTMDEEVIPYLESTLERVRLMITDILDKIDKKLH